MKHDSFDFVDINEIDNLPQLNSISEIDSYNFLDTDENLRMKKKVTKKVEFTYIYSKNTLSPFTYRLPISDLPTSLLSNINIESTNIKSTHIETNDKNLSSIKKNDVRLTENEEFIKYTLSSFIILLLIVILLKVFQNIFRRFCFLESSCDCTDNNLGIKLWTVTMIYNDIIVTIIAAYMGVPEIFKEFRCQFYIQLLLNALIMVIGAILIPGNTDILMNSRLCMLFLNELIIYIASLKYHKTWEKCWQYIKTDFIANVISLGFAVMITFFPLFIEILGSIITFNIIITIYLFAQEEFFLWLFDNIKIINGDQTLLNDKHIGQYDISLYSFFVGAEIGLMMRDKNNEWTFYYYLTIYSISSINQQTGIFSNYLKKFKFYLTKRWKKHQNLEWIVNERSLNDKLIAGRQFTSLLITLLIFISYFVTGQWIHIFRYNPGCTLTISVRGMNSYRIIMFIGTITVIDVICFLYHRCTNYANVIYHKRKHNIFLEGLVLLFRVFMMELVIYGILMANN